MLLHELEDLARLGEEAVVGVGDDQTGPGDAELRGDAVVEVLAAAEGRQPDDAGAETEGDLHRGGVHAPHLSVAGDAAEDGDRVADLALDRPGERRGGGVVRLEHHRPVAGGRGLGRGLERVDRALAVRIGTEVAVQVGGTGEVDAHRAIPSTLMSDELTRSL